MLMVNTLLIISFPNPLPSWGQQQMPHAVFPRRAERGVSGPARDAAGGDAAGAEAAALLQGSGSSVATAWKGQFWSRGTLAPSSRWRCPRAGRGSARSCSGTGGPAGPRCRGRPRPPGAFPPQAVKWRLLPTGSRTLPRKAWPPSFSPGPHRSFAYRSAGLSQRLQGSSRGAPVGSVPSPGTGTAGRAGCSRAGAQHRPRPPCRAPGVTPQRPT